MPMFIGLLIVLALFYQFCFRYETYESAKKPGVLIERDTLTGDERLLKPGSKVTLMGRIFGSRGGAGDSRYIEPWGSSTEPTESRIDPLEPASDADSATLPVDYGNPQQVEKIARPVPVPREVVVASSAPPVPNAGLAADESGGGEAIIKPFAIRQVDLNKDGATEEIIQNATQADGLLDISIVKNGREIFFGRGKQISLLPSRSEGWSDIVLKMGARTMQIFRYDPQEASYRALDSKT